MILVIGKFSYDTANFQQAHALSEMIKNADVKVLLSLQVQITHKAAGSKLEKVDAGLLAMIVTCLDQRRKQEREAKLEKLKGLYSGRNKLTLEQRDHLVLALRAYGLPLAAERVLLSCFDPEDAQTKAQAGWPVDFPKQPGKVWQKIKSRPNLDLYLIPKFRGIHYRGEPTSRFSDQEKFKEHVERDETGEPTFPPATFKMSPHFDFKRSTKGRRPSVLHKKLKRYDPNAAQRMLRSPILRSPLFSQGMTKQEAMNKYILPMLVQDVIDRDIHKKRNTFSITSIDKKDRTQPKKQRSQAQYEQQIYVNQYGTYERGLSKLSVLPGITQVSTSDNPYHAAMYAFGAKFSTEGEVRAKDEKKKHKPKTPKVEIGNTTGVRRTSGTVGKIYTYLFSPDELYLLQPNIVMVMQEEEEVAIKPLQQWETETTFIGEIPGQFLCAQTLANVPHDEQVDYTKKEKANAGQYLRQKFSKQYGPGLWKQAEEIAKRKGKILVPHGILARMLGDNDSIKQILAANEKHRASLAMESLDSFGRSLELASKFPASKREKIVVKAEGDLLLTYTRVPTPGDGNCLFHAVSIVVNSTYDNGSLRRRAVAHMRTHLLDFHFYEERDFANMEQVARGGEDEARWGGHPEIFALASTLGRRIVVHSPLYDAVHPYGYVVEPSGDVTGLDIHIFYNGGDHYEAML